jgi:transcriptional regulator of arginine metabolism
MKTRRTRLLQLEEIIRTVRVGSQDELLKELQAKGIEVTQATLSRDLKQLKVVKLPADNGEYIYSLSTDAQMNPLSIDSSAWKGILSIEFSRNLAVIKTRPGYASAVASDIDELNAPEFLGTIAGDDSVLLILRENVSHKQALRRLNAENV